MTASPRRAAPSAGRWRRVLRLWHRWFGLLAVVWLLALAITGIPIVFYDELDRALNPDWRTVSVSGEGVRLDAAIARADSSLSFTARFVDLPNAPGQSIMMLGSAPAAGEESRSLQVFADPATGALLGWRESGVLAFDRRHLMDTLYGLHVDLMLGEPMAWFLGLVALAWVLDHVAAAILAIPRVAKWRDAFLVGGRGFNLRRLFDLHRAPGLWAFPVTLVLAFSGLALAWHEEVRAAVRAVAPVSERLHESFPARPPAAEPIGPDAALMIVSARTGATADSVLLFPRLGVHGVRSFDPRDLDGMGRLWTYVDMADGAVLGERHDNGDGAGDAFFAWQYPLHSGKGLGLTGRWLVVAGGVATIWLCVSGIWLWLRRRPAA